MRKLAWLAAGLVVAAACHNRSEEQTGAAPAQGRTDTTAVTHAIDSTAVRDSAAANRGASPVSTPQDTLGPRNVPPGAADTAAVRRDSTMHHAMDSTMQHATPDTTRAK